MKNTSRSALVTFALIAVSLPVLQGCFPVVATGVGAGALMIADRRSAGTYVEDEGIEWKTASRIGEKFGSSTHVNATSYGRMVLLTGEVPDAQTKSEVEKITIGVPNVRAISNEIQVGPVSSYSARSNDAFLTSKVKARFVETDKFSATHVKVTTEAGTVFLMGLVTRKEADDATDIARTTGGVQKVVRVFEYIGEDQARQLDNRPPENMSPAKKP